MGNGKLTRILPLMLKTSEVVYYDKACASDEHSGGPVVVSESINSGNKALYRWESDRASGLLICSVAMRGDETTELFVEMMAGDGFMKDHLEILNALCDEASIIGADQVCAWVKTDIWEHFKKYDLPYRQDYVVVTYVPDRS